MMETKDIVKWWGFPKETIINRNLPKVQIYSHMKSVSDKQFLQDNVQSIYILASFKASNANIPTYESDEESYQEIQFLYVATKQQGASEKIYKMLSNLIPYPLVILTEDPKNFILYTGRFERLANNFLKLLNTYPSPVYEKEDVEIILEQIALSELPKQNLKAFYDGLRNVLSNELAKEQYGESLDDITSEKKDKLDDLHKQIEKLKLQIKKEQQLNRKLEMQMQLKKLKDEFQVLIKIR